MEQIKRAYQILKNDPAFRRRWRRGIGLGLAIWVVGQFVICTAMRLLRLLGR